MAANGRVVGVVVGPPPGGIGGTERLPLNPLLPVRLPEQPMLMLSVPASVTEATWRQESTAIICYAGTNSDALISENISFEHSAVEGRGAADIPIHAGAGTCTDHVN